MGIQFQAFLPVRGLTVNVDRVEVWRPYVSGHDMYGRELPQTGPERGPGRSRKRGCRGQRRGKRRTLRRRQVCALKRYTRRARARVVKTRDTVVPLRPSADQDHSLPRAVRRLARVVSWAGSWLSRRSERYSHEVQRRKELLARIAVSRTDHRRGRHRGTRRDACVRGHPDPRFGRILATSVASFQRKCRQCGLGASSKLLKEWVKEESRGGKLDLFRPTAEDLSLGLSFRLGVRTGLFETARRVPVGPPRPPGTRHALLRERGGFFPPPSTY